MARCSEIALEGQEVTDLRHPPSTALEPLPALPDAQRGRLTPHWACWCNGGMAPWPVVPL
jgi:hypothetical protein